MDNKLAIYGGRPVRTKPFPQIRKIGQEERDAVNRVLDNDLLSGFYGTWSKEFYGGPEVRNLERLWSEHFKVKHAISVNSASSGLQAAIAAAGVGPGDEVIVTPYSMIISATCPFFTGAIPVFADIDPRTFCISSETIKKVITPRTKAIVVVQLFGNTTDMDSIIAVAKKNKLVVIEDAAQAPDGMYRGKKTGTIGHMGVFSFNVHKTMSTGEGGMLVTNDDEYAERLQLVRNHGEAVVSAKGTKNITNMIGSNFRMCELEAAIASEQLKKIDNLTIPRIETAEFLSEKLKFFSGITPPYVDSKVRHVYYQYAIRYDSSKTKISKNRFVEAMNGEGIPLVSGYVNPIYSEPVFQEKIVYGDKGFPFSCKCYGEIDRKYESGMCPNVEQIESKEVNLHQIMQSRRR